MRIAIGADHAGFSLKEHLKTYLQAAGHEITDCGPHSEDRVDYPDYAKGVAHQITTGLVDRGVLVCGTGIGMAIAANKVAGIRAANCNTIFLASLSRAHNDANVVTVGARVVGDALAEAILKTFLSTAFDGGRHQDRLEKISRLR